MNDMFDFCIKELGVLGLKLVGDCQKRHESILIELSNLKEELTSTAEAVSGVVDAYIYCDDKTNLFNDDISNFKEVGNSRSDFSQGLHYIVKTAADIFREEWIRDYDYESIYLNFHDNDEREGGRYILLISSAIRELFLDRERDKYFNLIKLAFSESIEGKEDSAYAICQALGAFLTLQDYNLYYLAGDIISRIKENKRRSLSKISSKRKHPLYKQVVMIIEDTISQYPNVSVDSLAEKIIALYRQGYKQSSAPPSKKSIVTWINDDINYVPKKPFLHPSKYELITR